MVGMERSDSGDDLHNLEKFRCCPVVQDNGVEEKCESLDIGSQFDSLYYAKCPQNSYMQGMRRSGSMDDDDDKL